MLAHFRFSEYDLFIFFQFNKMCNCFFSIAFILISGTTLHYGNIFHKLCSIDVYFQKSFHYIQI